MMTTKKSKTKEIVEVEEWGCHYSIGIYAEWEYFDYRYVLITELLDGKETIKYSTESIDFLREKHYLLPEVFASMSQMELALSNARRQLEWTWISLWETLKRELRSDE